MRKRKLFITLGIVACIAALFFILIKPSKTDKADSVQVVEPIPEAKEEERTWEEVVSKEDLWLKTINDTYLFAEPFSDAKTVVKVPINKELDELACCFQGNQSMGWSKVSYDGTTGYIDMRDAEYIIEEEEEVVEVEETAEGVSEEEQHSIVEVNETDETAKVDEPAETTEPVETTEPTPTPQPTEAPKEEAQPSTAPTQNPNVTTKTEEQKRAETQQSAIDYLKSMGGTTELPIDNSGFGGFGGSGTKYGDLQ